MQRIRTTILRLLRVPWSASESYPDRACGLIQDLRREMSYRRNLIRWLPKSSPMVGTETARLRRALREGVVVIKGGASNKAFLLELLNRSEVQASQVHTGWLDGLASEGNHLSRVSAEVALVQAAIAAYDAELAIEQKQFYVSALRGRPQVRREIGRTVTLRYRGYSYSLKVNRL